MGTNFYRKRVVTDFDIAMFHELVDARVFTDPPRSITDEPDPYCSVSSLLADITNEIHIGKRSCGWQFSFDANEGKYYEPTRKGLDAWLREEGTVIVDEYGTKYTPDEFWKEVDEHNSDRDNWRTGTNSHTDGDYYLASECEYWKKKGYDVRWNEFFSDGLKFAVYTDFC